MEPRLDILLSVGNHFILLHVPPEEDDVYFAVLHAPDEDWN